MKKLQYILGVVVAILFTACAAGPDDPGLEYAPQMYHSTPYEPLTQITDESSGSWLDSNTGDDHGEYYNSNPYNEHKMNMRLPADNTVRRDQLLPYRIPKDSVQLAANLVSPYKGQEEAVLKEGQALYEVFCQHCHGEKGLGNGLVAEVYLGVSAYNAGATKDLPAGHIYHVITHGIRRMYAHGSQIQPDDRWKIVAYVQTLQQQ